MRKLVKGGCVALYVTAGMGATQAHFALYALLIRRAQRTHPHLFDGAAACRAIDVCIAEYAREYGEL